MSEFSWANGAPPTTLAGATEGFDKLAEDRIERLRRRVERYNAVAALGNSVFGSYREATAPRPREVPSPNFETRFDASPPPPPPPPRSGATSQLHPPTLDHEPSAPAFSSAEFEPEPLGGQQSSSKDRHVLFGAVSPGNAFGVREGSQASAARAPATLEPDNGDDDILEGYEDDTDCEVEEEKFVNVVDAPTLHEPLDERLYHQTKQTSIAAEVYAARQSLVGSSLFTDVFRWNDSAMEARNNRIRLVQEEALLQSRWEETSIQLDELIRKSSVLSADLSNAAEARHHQDMAPFRAREDRLEAKRALVDEKMSELQRDLMLLDRRRSQVVAAENNNDAKAREQHARQAQLTSLRNDIADRKRSVEEKLSALSSKEEKVVRWTEILSRREAAISQREAAALKAAVGIVDALPASTNVRKENAGIAPSVRGSAPVMRFPLQAKEELNIGAESDGCDDSVS